MVTQIIPTSTSNFSKMLNEILYLLDRKIFYLFSLLFLLNTQIAICQKTTDSSKINITVQQKETPKDTKTSNEKSGFVATFVKTPFAFFSLIFTFIGLIISAMIEFVCNLFTLFNFGFQGTSQIWEMGWRNIIVEGWWNPAVGWHLAVSIIFWWIALLFGGK